MSHAQSFENARTYLPVQFFELREPPLVIQFNKRDLNNMPPDEELERIAGPRPDGMFSAVASRGVAEALGLSEPVARLLASRFGVAA